MPQITVQNATACTGQLASNLTTASIKNYPTLTYWANCWPQLMSMLGGPPPNVSKSALPVLLPALSFMHVPPWAIATANLPKSFGRVLRLERTPPNVWICEKGRFRSHLESNQEGFMIVNACGEIPFFVSY